MHDKQSRTHNIIVNHFFSKNADFYMRLLTHIIGQLEKHAMIQSPKIFFSHFPYKTPGMHIPLSAFSYRENHSFKVTEKLFSKLKTIYHNYLKN